MVKKVACMIVQVQSKKEPGWQRRELFWMDSLRNGEFNMAVCKVGGFLGQKRNLCLLQLPVMASTCRTGFLFADWRCGPADITFDFEVR